MQITTCCYFFCNLWLQEILCSVGFCHFILLLNAWGGGGAWFRGSESHLSFVYGAVLFACTFISNIRIYIIILSVPTEIL